MIRFLRTLTHFFALILWVAAGLAFLVAALDPAGGMAPLGFAIVGVILLNGAFSFWQEYRALRELLPRQAKVLRDGDVCIVPAEQVVPGDVIALESGDEVPADVGWSRHSDCV